MKTRTTGDWEYNFWKIWLIVKYFELYQSIFSVYLCLSQDISGYLSLFRSILGYLRLSWAISGHLDIDSLRLYQVPSIRVQIEAGESQSLLYFKLFDHKVREWEILASCRGARAPKKAINQWASNILFYEFMPYVIHEKCKDSCGSLGTLQWM